MNEAGNNQGNDCAECRGKVADVTQRVTLIEAEISHVKAAQDTSTYRFETHMQKEEKAFDSFYSTLRSMEKRVSEIVMRGMEDTVSLRESLRDESKKAQAEVMEEISDIKSRFLSKQTAYIAFAAAAAAVSITIFLFSTFTVDTVSKNNNTQMREMTRQITKEIHDNNAWHKQREIGGE